MSPDVVVVVPTPAPFRRRSMTTKRIATNDDCDCDCDCDNCQDQGRQLCDPNTVSPRECRTHTRPPGPVKQLNCRAIIDFGYPMDPRDVDDVESRASYQPMTKYACGTNQLTRYIQVLHRFSREACFHIHHCRHAGEDCSNWNVGFLC